MRYDDKRQDKSLVRTIFHCDFFFSLGGRRKEASDVHCSDAGLGSFDYDLSATQIEITHHCHGSSMARVLVRPNRQACRTHVNVKVEMS
jgi:hypothetical protein